MLRYLIAGESHGMGLLGILEGLPSGLKLNPEIINQELRRRQAGFGRGKRMLIENDSAQVISGIRRNVTIGSPIGVLIKNKDFKINKLADLISPRPGHADLPGLLKYGFSDARSVLERASARSTVATVAIGALCKIFLSEFKIKIYSRVISIGAETTKNGMREKIEQATKNKDTVGGIFEIIALGVPPGLGSYVHPDKRLDGCLAQAIMSIPGVKAVEVGLGFGYAQKFGSLVHDQIFHSKREGFYRKTNNAGGIEGGISNGEDILVRACMKPIATLMKPLGSVNIRNHKETPASVQRSDICVVESAGVVAESCMAFELSRVLLEKFGNDNLSDIKAGYSAYLKRIKY
ncbi:MAG: chorismate synthase [Candidatus Omnitrophota bacterium]